MLRAAQRRFADAEELLRATASTYAALGTGQSAAAASALAALVEALFEQARHGWRDAPPTAAHWRRRRAAPRPPRACWPQGKLHEALEYLQQQLALQARRSRALVPSSMPSSMPSSIPSSIPSTPIAPAALHP
jgi:hypothetical protein